MIVNVFYVIFFADIFLMTLFFFIGWYAVEKEHKDNWGDSKTMEFRKSTQLSEEWSDKHLILDFMQSFYYELRRKKDVPMDTYRNIKYFIQRGKRGYSDSDLWGFYSHLNTVIKEGCIWLRKNKNGTPCAVDNGDIPKDETGSWSDEGGALADAKWNKILDSIIWTFEANDKIEKNDWVLVGDESRREELKKFVKRYNSPDRKPLFKGITLSKKHLMTKKEMDKYNEGWKNFRDYFFCLWD